MQAKFTQMANFLLPCASQSISYKYDSVDIKISESVNLYCEAYLIEENSTGKVISYIDEKSTDNC